MSDIITHPLTKLLQHETMSGFFNLWNLFQTEATTSDFLKFGSQSKWISSIEIDYMF